ncbi:MAG: LUD domain-containing protein, partial [Acidobacteria bacterium]|nr:LUD domain-containing protein [Acidobacteriota bacterium]
MTKAARAEILKSIRDALQGEHQQQAVAEEGKTSAAPSMPNSIERTKEGGEVRELELVARFEHELTRVGGRFYHAENVQEVCDYVKKLAAERFVQSAVSWDSSKFEGGELLKDLEIAGIEVAQDYQGVRREDLIDKSIKADLCISGVDYALADTGTLVLCAGEGKARS